MGETIIKLRRFWETNIREILTNYILHYGKTEEICLLLIKLKQIAVLQYKELWGNMRSILELRSIPITKQTVATRSTTYVRHMKKHIKHILCQTEHQSIYAGKVP